MFFSYVFKISEIKVQVIIQTKYDMQFQLELPIQTFRISPSFKAKRFSWYLTKKIWANFASFQVCLMCYILRFRSRRRQQWLRTFASLLCVRGNSLVDADLVGVGCSGGLWQSHYQCELKSNYDKKLKKMVQCTEIKFDDLKLFQRPYSSNKEKYFLTRGKLMQEKN